MKHVYLLTGRPGTGKTRLIKQVASRMRGGAGGFYTEEIRQGGVRQGFRLVTLDGKEAILAHINIRSPYRVGKYGVDTTSLDRLGVPALNQAASAHQLIVIDEIGKMELLSADFKAAISRIINSGKRVLGTIMSTSHPWADTIKCQPQVNLISVTRTNHSEVLAELSDWLKIRGLDDANESNGQ